MERNRYVRLALISVVGLVGCSSHSVPTVNLMYMADDNKVALHVAQGTVINFEDASGVTFPFGNPCTESNPSNQCTVNAAKARVPFSCTGCADPEIVVGSYPLELRSHAMQASVTTAPTGIVYMACNSGQVAIGSVPSPLNISVATAAAGAIVSWVPGGLNEVGSDWTASNFSTTICGNNPTFKSGANTCTVDPHATQGSTTYSVTSASCGGNPAQGTITITP